MEEALRLFMLGNIDLTALIGDGSDDTHPFRWYRIGIPQNATLPAVTNETQSVDRSEGYSQTGAGEWCRRVIQLTVVARTADAMDAVWDIIRKALQRFHRTANQPVGQMAGVNVMAAIITSEQDGYEPPEANEAVGYFLKVATVEFTHQEEE